MIHLLLAVIYLAFISLGLPDALLGGAWPTIYQEWNVPVSWAGAVYMIISLGTVVSSLMSDRLTRALGAGKVTALSVAATAAALWGYSHAAGVRPGGPVHLSRPLPLLPAGISACHGGAARGNGASKSNINIPRL